MDARALNAPRRIAARGDDTIARTAALGAALTLGVLAISVWLRVNTSLDAAGVAATNLAAASQEWLRRGHRLAAAGEGLVALALAVLLVRRRAHAGLWAAFAVVIVATLGLAAIGRLTPGYRLSWVTVANVAGAVVLAAAFWRIRESTATLAAHHVASAFVTTAVVLALLQVALGATASAAALQHGTLLDPWHAGSGLVVLAFCIVAAARARAVRIAPRVVVALLVAVQFVTGFRLAAVGEAGAPAGALAHALGAALVVLALGALLQRAPPEAQ